MEKIDFKNLVNDNDRNMNLLKNYHQKEIQKCLTYVQARGVNKSSYEHLRKDLISMCFEREIRNEFVDFSNIETFCDAYIEKYQKGKNIAVLHYFASSLLVYFIFDLFFSNINEINIMTVFRSILTLSIISIFYYVLPHFALASNKNVKFIFLAFLFLTVIVTYGVLHIVDVTVFFVIPWWIRFSFTITFFVITTIFWNRFHSIFQ